MSCKPQRGYRVVEIAVLLVVCVSGDGGGGSGGDEGQDELRSLPLSLLAFGL